MNNTLFYGDNLQILRKYVASDSVDLCYIDPPFNSSRNYNIIFKEQSGDRSPAQMKAFTDTWTWNENAYHVFREESSSANLVSLIDGFVQVIGRNDVTAYLVMMAPRILEIWRCLKPTGSFYLHCDSTVSHYLKIILDFIFGVDNFRNEIIWKRTNVHNDSKTWSKVSDTIFFYSKSNSFTFNPIYMPHSDEILESKYRYQDENGRFYTLDNMTSPNPRPNMMYEWQGHAFPPNGWRYSRETMQKYHDEGRIWYPEDKSKRPRFKRYLDEMPGVLMGNVWSDISPLNSQAAERLGYPTQKPLSLLERIISASSNSGDVVLDAFCGCGTAIVAAQKLNRNWIGIDVSHLAIALIKYRLSDSFKLKEKTDYQVIGEPTTEVEAKALALEDRDEFQKWAIGLIERARPSQDKKGADGGIDGVLFFRDDYSVPKKAVIQVKSGGVQVGQIRDFAHVLQRENATLGFFITLENPTAPMLKEAAALSFYTSALSKNPVPKLQIRTVKELLEGKTFEFPRSAELVSIKQAATIQEDTGQKELF